MEREVWEGNGQNQATAESNEGSEAVRGEDRDPYLPAAIGEEDHGDGDGGAGHGMGGGHAVLRVVENLQLDHGWRGGPRPADDVLGALAQVHDQHPDDHEPPAHQGVQVPDPEGEEQYVKEFVAQLRAEAEQVVERPVTHVGQLALLARQRVAAQKPRAPRRGWAHLGRPPVPHAVGGAAVAQLGRALIAVAPGRRRASGRPRLPLSAPGFSGEVRLRLLILPRVGGGRGCAAHRRFHPAQLLETGHFLRVLQTAHQLGQPLPQRHDNGTPRPAGRRTAARGWAGPRRSPDPSRRAYGSDNCKASGASRHQLGSAG